MLAGSLTAEPMVIRAARVIDGRGKVMENAAVVVDVDLPVAVASVGG